MNFILNTHDEKLTAIEYLADPKQIKLPCQDFLLEYFEIHH